VTPGDRHHSYLYLKVLGTNGVSGQSPHQLVGSLSACETEAIGQWIDDGALNN